IAGLVAPDGGVAKHGERTLFDVGARVDLPARNRSVALVSQADSLFTTMSVIDNVAFGPRARGVSKAQARRLAETWLGRVDAAALSGRRACALSRGRAR